MKIERTIDFKFKTVIEKNTFYFFDLAFEEKYEGYLNSLKETLLILKNDIDNHGLREEILEDLLVKNENGLKAILALTGFSNESFQRLITIIRISDNSQLNDLTLKNKWSKDEYQVNNNLREWSTSTIARLIKQNVAFRKGIVNVFFKGSTIPFLIDIIPLFEGVVA